MEPARVWTPVSGKSGFHGLAGSQPGWLQVRQEGSQQADRREKRADRIYEIDAGDVGQLTQNSSAQPRHTKGEPKAETGNHSYSSGHQLLSVDDNHRKSRRQNQSNDHTENFSPQQIGIRQCQSEGKNAKNRAPNDSFSADSIPDRPANDGTESYSAQKHE